MRLAPHYKKGSLGHARPNFPILTSGIRPVDTGHHHSREASRVGYEPPKLAHVHTSDGLLLSKIYSNMPILWMIPKVPYLLGTCQPVTVFRSIQIIILKNIALLPSCCQTLLATYLFTVRASKWGNHPWLPQQLTHLRSRSTARPLFAGATPTCPGDVCTLT